MVIKINLTNKALYSIIAIAIVLTISGIAIAYGSNDPSLHGHDSGEISGVGTSGATPTDCEILQCATEECSTGTPTGVECFRACKNYNFACPAGKIVTEIYTKHFAYADYWADNYVRGVKCCALG